MIIYYAIKYLPILTCIWSYLYYKKNKPKEYSVNKIGNGNGNVACIIWYVARTM